MKAMYLALPLALLLSACGGSNKDYIDDDHDHDDEATFGGRLIYSSNADDSLAFFDQTNDNQFDRSTVAAKADAKLVLSRDGLKVAMLEGTNLSIVSSGLEHLHDSHPHTHELSLASSAPFAGVAQVLATGAYFSTLDSDGKSRLISVDGKEVAASWANARYPSLALAGGDFLIFSANADDSSTDIRVVDAQGNSGTDGLIWARPNADGVFVPAMNCPDGVKDSAQSEDFTLLLCGDGTLRWLISGYEAVDGHPQAGKTLHVTQRYPATSGRREGALGEVTTGSKGFIGNISALSATWHDDDVIAAWAGDQLWLINAHNDHPHRKDLSTLVGSDFGAIKAVAAAYEDDAIAILSDSGKLAISRFALESSTPAATGETVREDFAIGADLSLMASGLGFWLVDRAAGELISLDAHSSEDDYHLHGRYSDESVKNASSVVFAYPRDEDSDHDHDHDHDH